MTRFATVMIVEDHPLFSDALAMTLQSLPGVREVAREECLGDALDTLEASAPPDLVLLDLNLPDVNGLDGLLRLKATVGEVPVLVVSSITDSRTVAAAIAAGASGYVPKHSQRAVFGEAFAALSEGELFLPDSLAAPGEARTGEGVEALRRLRSLTPQQGRILALICDGKLNKQIAWELSIAEATVKAHVTAIMRKLGVQSRTQAVLVAREARFDTLADQGTAC